MAFDVVLREGTLLKTSRKGFYRVSAQA